jgi:GMP synthase (glutamine-hydrolysing)
MTRTALVLRHVEFEHLGILGPLLAGRGLQIDMRDAPVADLRGIDVRAPDLLVVLGGPIGVYEQDLYPFLTDELRLIERRLAAGRPLLGVCLGAQLIAHALGARVYPGKTKEIGFAPVALTDAGGGSALAPLNPDVAVLHWHGDTFDLPAGAVRLASTGLTPNQAFAAGDAVLGLQFHAEVDWREIERWLVGHAHEIASVPGLAVTALREDARRLGPPLMQAGRRVFEAWLDAALPDAGARRPAEARG